MTSPKLADLTLPELEGLITKIVRQQLRQPAPPQLTPQQLQELFAAVDRDRWTPPPGTPKLSDLIAEDREQWRRGM